MAGTSSPLLVDVGLQAGTRLRIESDSAETIGDDTGGVRPGSYLAQVVHEALSRHRVHVGMLCNAGHHVGGVDGIDVVPGPSAQAPGLRGSSKLGHLRCLADRISANYVCGRSVPSWA